MTPEAAKETAIIPVVFRYFVLRKDCKAAEALLKECGAGENSERRDANELFAVAWDQAFSKVEENQSKEGSE